MAVSPGMRRYLNQNRQGQLLNTDVRERQAEVVNRVPEEYETQKYDDLGLIMTPTQYGEVRSDLDASQAARAKALGKLSSQEQLLNASVAEQRAAIESQMSALDAERAGLSVPDMNSLWNQYESNFHNVRVIGPNNSIEATYRLPKEIIDTLDKQAFNQGDYSYTANWVDNGAFYNVSAQLTTSDEWYGKELHEMLQGATRDTKSYFEQQNAGAIADAQHQIDMANMQYDAYGNQLAQAGKDLTAQQQGYMDQINQSRQAVSAAKAEEKRVLQSAKDRFERNMEAARGTALGIGVKR